MFFYGYTFFLIVPTLILAIYAQSKVKGAYKKYQKITNSSGLSGAEIAQKILNINDLQDIQIKKIAGELTDNYHPTKKTLFLSQNIFSGRSISALGIAAHEVGHAIQHARGYFPLQIRNSIFPVASFGSQLAFPMFLIGLLFRTGFLMDLGIILFVAALLFHIVTLPVEFNASHIALQQLSAGIIESKQELSAVKKILNAAALTYVASTLMALMQLIRLLILRNARD